MSDTPSLALLNNIAVMHHTLNHYTQAKEFYTQALACDSTHPSVLYNIARLYEDEGNSLRASDFYNQILSIHPAYSDAALRLAIIQYEAANYTDALDAFNHILFQKNIDALIYKGKCHLALGQLRECKKDLGIHTAGH